MGEDGTPFFICFSKGVQDTKNKEHQVGYNY